MISENRVLPLFEDYDPARFPVYPNYQWSSPIAKLKVGLATKSGPMEGEPKHFLYDAIVGSEYLDFVAMVYVDEWSPNNRTNQARNTTAPVTPSDADLWIVDGHRTFTLPPDSPFLLELFGTKNDAAPTWKALIMSFADRYGLMENYVKRYNIGPKQTHVRASIRTIIRGRDYIQENHTIIPGYIVPNVPTAGGPTLHNPYAVRRDTVQMLQSILHANTTKDLQFQLESSSSNISRPMDVIHLWEPTYMKHHRRLSRLRNTVSELIQTWNGKDISEIGFFGGDDNMTSANTNTSIAETSNPRIVQASTKEKGHRRAAGRHGVKPSYIQAMLGTKIAIVAQKDRWEGALT